jgi:cysteine-rich repeat protein
VMAKYEACDDANMVSNDGCSSMCANEVYTLSFNDASGVDDVPPNVFLDWFNTIQDADASDYLYVAVLGAGVPAPGAWCSSNADWYRTTYINAYGVNGSPASGNWDKWGSVDGINWSGTINGAFTNYFGANCDGTLGSWCTEWGLNSRFVGLFPGQPASESYASNFNNSNTTVTIRLAPTRMLACGF